MSRGGAARESFAESGGGLDISLFLFHCCSFFGAGIHGTRYPCLRSYFRDTPHAANTRLCQVFLRDGCCNSGENEWDRPRERCACSGLLTGSRPGFFISVCKLGRLLPPMLHLHHLIRKPTHFPSSPFPGSLLLGQPCIYVNLEPFPPFHSSLTHFSQFPILPLLPSVHDTRYCQYFLEERVTILVCSSVVFSLLSNSLPPFFIFFFYRVLLNLLPRPPSLEFQPNSPSNPTGIYTIL